MKKSKFLNKSKLLWKSCKYELKENKKSFIVYSILRLSIVIILIRNIIIANYEASFTCVLALILMLVPSLVQASFRVDISEKLEIIIYLFIYAAEVLGEIHAFYEIFPFWDKILHIANGFIAAAIGYSLVKLFNNNKDMGVKMSPFFIFFVAFCFSMTVGIFWEFIECFVDFAFGSDTQKDTLVTYVNTIFTSPAGQNIVQKISGIQKTIIITNDSQVVINNGYLDVGLYDTMQDLFVNLLGALVFSVGGYINMKKGKKSIDHGLEITKSQKDKNV